MKIRTITHFVPLLWPADKSSIDSAARFLTDARFRFTEAGIEVQSVCLATPPFLDVLGYPDADLLFEFGHALEEIANRHQIDQVSIGPLVATTPHALLMPIYAFPDLIAKTQKINASVLFADEFSGVNLAAAQAFAEVIHKIAESTPMGQGNLRLGALANVPPNVPLPHAAYHHGGTSYFIIGTEAADLALDAVESTRTMTDANRFLKMSIENSMKRMEHVIDTLVDSHNIRFKGVDFSLSPYPTQSRSIGQAIESLGIEGFGGSGTLFATAFLSNAIRQARIPHTGLSAVMMPVLGDTVIAKRAAEGNLSVNDLLLYSAIGNSGLDIVPIPGDTTSDEIGAIFLDMAALSISSSRAICARLLPIPGLVAGDKVSMDDEFLTDSHVLAVKHINAQPLFDANSFFSLRPLPSRQRTRSEILEL